MKNDLQAANILQWLPLLLLVPFVVPVPGVLDRIYVLRALGGLAHFILPGLLTYYLYFLRGARGRLGRAALIAFLLSAGCELLQSFVGRHPRLHDAGIDLAGVLFASSFIMRRQGRPRWLYLPAMACLLLLPIMYWSLPGVIRAQNLARERFPLLADFETDAELKLWSLRDANIGSLQLREYESAEGRYIGLVAEPDDLWPAVSVTCLPRDWTGYTNLSFDACIIDGDRPYISLTLTDHEGVKNGRWCEKRMWVDDQWRGYELNLRELAANMEDGEIRLDDISRMSVYVSGVEQRTLIGFDNFRLE
jgi:VanZ family protein